MKVMSEKELNSEAKKAYHNAYAPYSNFKVGASVLASDQIYSGCNVENASYGLTVCAERNAIGKAVSNGVKKISKVVIYTEIDDLTPPCGACRQVIAEFIEPSGEIVAINHKNQEKRWSISALLPDAFTPEDLLNRS